MTNRIGVSVRCRLLGEFVDDANAETTATANPGGENVRPQMLGDFIEDAAADQDVKKTPVIGIFEAGNQVAKSEPEA